MPHWFSEALPGGAFLRWHMPHNRCMSIIHKFLSCHNCIIQHDLPIIDSIEAIENLTDNQLKRYHQLYCPLYPGVNGELSRPIRTREVLKVIGSNVGLIP